MPRVSKNRILDKKKKWLFLDDFASAITLLEHKQEAYDFLWDLLTMEERMMLAKRIQVAMMLLEEYNWEDIDEYVKVTAPTINHVKLMLVGEKGGLKKIAERILDLKKAKLARMRKGKRIVKAPKTFGSELLKAALGLALGKTVSTYQKRRKRKSVEGKVKV